MIVCVFIEKLLLEFLFQRPWQAKPRESNSFSEQRNVLLKRYKASHKERNKVKIFLKYV